MAQMVLNGTKPVVLNKEVTYSQGEGISIVDKVVNVNYDPETMEIKSNGTLGALVDIPVPPLESNKSYRLICNVLNGIPYYAWEEQ